MNTFTADFFDDETYKLYRRMIYNSSSKKELVEIYRFLLQVSDNSYMSNDYIPNIYINNVNHLMDRCQVRLAEFM